jgi:predicted  nucleic acid-binding Zn-ribbon protein
MSENLLRAVEVVSDWLRNLSASVSSLLTRVEHIEKDQGHMQRRLDKLEERLLALEEKGEKEWNGNQ